MNLNKISEDQITPCGYHVLIELREVEETTESGILLTSAMQNREQAAMPIGKILKFGPLCYKNHDSGIDSPEEWGVKVGDHVQFPAHTYMKVAGEKSNLVFILDHDIKARVEL